MNTPDRANAMLRGLLPALVVAGVAWWACNQVIKPYSDLEKRDQEAITGLREQVNAATSVIRASRTYESDARAIQSQVDRFEQDLPGASVLTSLPEQLKKHFAPFGMTLSSARMNSVREDAEMPGYNHGYWSVALGQAEIERNPTGALWAAANFEQQHPFVRILDFAVLPDPEVPERWAATLKLRVLFRK